MTNTAFIYVRISQDRTGEGTAPERQEGDCRKLADDLGLTVADVFADRDISASVYGGKPRPAYEEMLSRLSEVDAVLCWHMDRLHRQPVELEHYVKVVNRHGVETHAVKGGKVDFATPEGLLSAGLLGLLARYESDHKSDRIRRKSEENALAGRWRGGVAPFGWDAVDGELILNEAEAALVREASHAVLAGRSLGSVCRSWDASGLPPRGRKGEAGAWSYATVRQALLRPRNAGFSVLRGEIVGKLQAEPIVSENVWHGVKAVLTDPKRRRSQSNKAVHLLAGIAHCHCGELVKSATVTNRKGEKYRIYKCPAKGRGHVGKRIGYVDEVVEELAVIAWRVARSRRGSGSGVDAELDALRHRESEAQQRLDGLAEAYADGLMDARQVGLASERIRAEVLDLQGQASALEVRQARAESLQVQAGDGDPMESAEAIAWQGMGVDARRDFVRSNMAVVLMPHHNGSPRVFDRGTVLAALLPTPGPLPAEAVRAFAKDHWDDEPSPYRLIGFEPEPGP